ncbi:hypothetical protein AB4Y42_42690 [Paraburkholderia sp. EG286B]|uniref:hypothetical protein n=1 Tax=Paraburkholderia sp. EG286B TaxID=3237011 RepID=UPI0034D2F9F1
MTFALQIIFASGNDPPDARDVGFAFAAVRKPFSAEQLRDLIEASIKQQTDGESALRARGASWGTALPDLN